MSDLQLPRRLDAAIRAGGVAIAGVSIGDPAIRSTWKVTPASLQSAAQPIIDAFNPSDPTLLAQELADQSLATSRQKDILTQCAMLVRARIGTAAWNALTTPQKVTATVAEADVWKNIREFLDDKV